PRMVRAAKHVAIAVALSPETPPPPFLRWPLIFPEAPAVPPQQRCNEPAPGSPAVAPPVMPGNNVPRCRAAILRCAVETPRATAPVWDPLSSVGSEVRALPSTRPGTPRSSISAAETVDYSRCKSRYRWYPAPARVADLFPGSSALRPAKRFLPPGIDSRSAYSGLSGQPIHAATPLIPWN